jgi:hypothetical protein
MVGATGRTDPDLLAVALAGSWRKTPSTPELTTDELGRIVAKLVGSGAAALAWWTLRRSSIRDSIPADKLKQSYHTQTLQSALQEWEVEHIFSLLRSAGVEPILLKGWAVAAVYPERGLRPLGDIDLCVRPEQYGAAKAALWGPGRRGTTVADLTHDASALAGSGGWERLYARSRLIPLNDSQIRVLGHEDLLRFLCIHLLRHSAYRPLWLCDIAAVLEAVPPDFDWNIALGDDALKRNWVTCVLDLSRRLLGVRFDHVPEEIKAFRAPEWLIREVLTQWNRPCTAERRPHELIAVSLRRPFRVLPALLARWPDPIRASVGLKLPLDESPRLPRQFKFYIAQSAAFLKRPLQWAQKPIKSPGAPS